MSYSPEEKGFLEGTQQANAEWIRVLTAYLPDMVLPLYSPRSVGEWIKERLKK